MKALFLFTAMFLFAMVCKSEEIFFPSKEGTVLVYKTFDKKDKQTNTMKYTITHLKTNGDNMDITYLCESMDSKDKLIFKDEITVHKIGDKLYFDMSKFINKAAFQKDGEIPANVEITGNNMEIPSNPTPGEALPDANVVMAMKMGIITMKMSAEVTNRKVESIEDITVTGGTFNCYKFTSDVNTSGFGFKMKVKSAEWYAKGIGVVKSESYDKNGNLQSRTELMEVRKS
ncbi:hypothetical protein [uncultured Bacteroides sp.]|uniref:TapB family protein n=1 Tax=uncultured Bacteroides sp. TaxID=162156 RepID=UPI002AAC221B|nr:hypothetical protein [uncultured Bacteroides sp.]